MCMRMLCIPAVLRVLRCRLRNHAAHEALLWPAWFGQRYGVRLPQAEAILCRLRPRQPLR
jgi:hypothetical protein